ncbi:MULTISPECIES: S1C family serine protease [Saccharibacillus]|uniref:S1C family serine protease n=1 Tax=Saccharibacillus TaxID=456492 RepID=UPI00123A022D|nr:S1C family serine protease [Saccharibacillus sp. WB 17]MWJ31947.1 trypsin-like serine protease [Saccharibacillus sp. WB 17]
MKKQTLISLIVSASIVLAGSAGSYAIHRNYSAHGGEGALLAATSAAASSPGSGGAAASNTPAKEQPESEGDKDSGQDAGQGKGQDTGKDAGSEAGTEPAVPGEAGSGSQGGEASSGSGQGSDLAGQGGEPDEPDEPGEPTLKEIISSVGEKVVMIETSDGSIGSGFLYNDRGDILTNAHVVSGFTDVTVTTSGSEEMSGTVIGIGEETDVAVVRVADLAGVEPLELKLEAEAEIGDEVLALGSPLGLQNTVTTGIVSGVDRTFDIAPYYYEGLYQISAPIAPGNSGGPLVDRTTGQVLGINSAVTDEGGIGFSIPVVSIVESARGWSDDPMDTLPTPESESGGSGEDAGIGEDYGLEGDDPVYDSTDLEYAAEDVLYAFYDAVSLEDYRTAYDLLGPTWQKKQSFEDFEAGYADTLGVYLDYCVGVENTDETVTVYVSITADEREGDGATSVAYDLVYQVGYGQGDAADELQIISGESQ